MRFPLVLPVAIGLLLGAAGAVHAQERVGREASPRDGRPIRFQGGLFADHTDLPGEVADITTSGLPGPDTKSEANTEITYRLGHQVLGAMLGVHVAPPAARGLEFEVSLLVASVTTSIGMDADEGSIFVPAGNPTDDFHQSMEDRGGDLGFGALLRGTYLLQDLVVVGLDLQYLQGKAEINNATFFGDLVDGDYTFSRILVHLLVGVQRGPVQPYLGIGFLQYQGNADLEEANDPTNPDTWDADFEPDGQFRLLLGIQAVERLLGARVELHLLPALGVTVGVFIRI